jgi:hypothetical protein
MEFKACPVPAQQVGGSEPGKGGEGGPMCISCDADTYCHREGTKWPQMPGRMSETIQG